MSLPPYIVWEQIRERLLLIFPVGIHVNRNYLTREMTAKTIFTMLYIGAVDGVGHYLAPSHVYRMTDKQASLDGHVHRENYYKDALKKNYNPPDARWYADNTREPIRDETIREGLMAVGAVLSLQGIPTTSSKPRYYLQSEFAELFNPLLGEQELRTQIAQWQEANLSKSSLTRLRLASLGKNQSSTNLLVTFPNKETRTITAGPSSIISKAVIEVFAPMFLDNPAVLWLSTSDGKVVTRDEKVASLIGLKIEADKNLPDIILVDLAAKHPLLVFVEVVATDGAITNRRQEAVYELTDNAGFLRSQVAFVTAYHDKSSVGFSKTIRSIAWNSFVWFASEPDKLLIFYGKPTELSSLPSLSNFLIENSRK